MKKAHHLAGLRRVDGLQQVAGAVVRIADPEVIFFSEFGANRRQSRTHRLGIFGFRKSAYGSLPEITNTRDSAFH
ncbi:MAG: hypothetical protein QM757_23915 [Paludibaculum sp.]